MENWSSRCTALVVDSRDRLVVALPVTGDENPLGPTLATVLVKCVVQPCGESGDQQAPSELFQFFRSSASSGRFLNSFSSFAISSLSVTTVVPGVVEKALADS